MMQLYFKILILVPGIQTAYLLIFKNRFYPLIGISVFSLNSNLKFEIVIWPSDYFFFYVQKFKKLTIGLERCLCNSLSSHLAKLKFDIYTDLSCKIRPEAFLFGETINMKKVSLWSLRELRGNALCAQISCGEYI